MDLILPDPGTLIWTAVTFIILFGALAVFAWPKILTALKEREEKIAGDIEGAETARKEAESRLTTLGKKLDDAKAEANAIIDEGRSDAENLRNEILEEGRKEVDALRSRVTREIELAKDKAVDELRKEAIELSFELARRVVEKAIEPKEHVELVDRFIAEFDKTS